jgi:hypothetical protein
MRVAVATATTPPRQATPTGPARRPKPLTPGPSRARPPIIGARQPRVKAACGAAPAGAPRTLTQARRSHDHGSYQDTGSDRHAHDPHHHNPANH